jgi:hypothetical protein
MLALNNMNSNFTRSDAQSNLKMLLNTITELTLIDLDLVWKKDKLDNQAYILIGKWSGYKMDKVWKSGSEWCGYSGVDFKLLKEAKREAETRVKLNAIDELITLNGLMKEVGRSYFSHSVSRATYEIIGVVLDKLMSAYLDEALKNTDGLKLRGVNNRLGNALAAFDYNGDMASFLGCSINYSYSTDRCVINPSKIGFRASINKDIGGDVLQIDRSFDDDRGQNLSYIRSFEDEDLNEAMVLLKDAVFNHMNIIKL